MLISFDDGHASQGRKPTEHSGCFEIVGTEILKSRKLKITLTGEYQEVGLHDRTRIRRGYIELTTKQAAKLANLILANVTDVEFQSEDVT